MKANFDRCLSFVLKYEGGYVNAPQDPGGETNMGISKRSYPTENIKDMTRARAAQIYKRDYWDAVRGDELPAGLDLVAFDAAVNNDVSRGSKWLQEAVGVPAADMGSLRQGLGSARRRCACNGDHYGIGEPAARQAIYQKARVEAARSRTVFGGSAVRFPDALWRLTHVRLHPSGDSADHRGLPCLDTGPDHCMAVEAATKALEVRDRDH